MVSHVGRPSRAAAGLVCAFVAAAALVGEALAQSARCTGSGADSCQYGDMAGRNLDGADVSYANYAAIHMRGASLKGATAERLNLQTADVEAVDFSGADLNHATLFAANAVKARFVAADLSGANFTRANLAGADFSRAKIDATTLFIGARLGSATWIDGRVCAEGSIGRCD